MTDITPGWYRRKCGEIVYVVGLSSDGECWIVQGGRQTSGFLTLGCAGSELAERLPPECTGFDWKPQRSLGERLELALRKGNIGETTLKALRVGEGDRKKSWSDLEEIAEAFLRDVLTPPAGKTLAGLWNEASGLTNDYKSRASHFLKALTGVEL